MSSASENPKSDRISTLPDSIIYHILSFLPTSKDAVKTGVLSKRWDGLWSSVPNLIFRYPNDRKNNVEDFLNFVQKTLILYSSSKIKKFIVDFDYEYEEGSPLDLDSCIGLWIRFASRHYVEELCLEFCKFHEYNEVKDDEEDHNNFIYYVLPQYFYNNSKLVKLKSRFCDYMPNGKVYWNSLKILSITYAAFSDDAVNKILQGSPVLECFELHKCNGIENLDITSKSLKKLVINGIWNFKAEDYVSMIEISAPNLLSLQILGHWYRRKCRLMNVSSLVDASLNFELTVDELESNNSYANFYAEHRNMLKELLEKVDHVKELTLGTWCIQVLSMSVLKGLRPQLSCKCLILDNHFDKWDLPGLASLLYSSPKLEKLVIDMSSPAHREFVMHSELYNSRNFSENYWTQWTKMIRIFKCLEMHLETIEIVGLKAGRHGNELLLAFLQFLLLNAQVLEKMVITDNCDQYRRKRDLYEVAQKLLSFPRYSRNAVILLPK